MAIISAVWAAILLVSSALVAVTADHYEDKKYCDAFDKFNLNPQCGQLIGGAVRFSRKIPVSSKILVSGKIPVSSKIPVSGKILVLGLATNRM